MQLELTNPEKKVRFRAAVLGVGRWGINIARVFAQEPSFDLRYIVDLDCRSYEQARRFAPMAVFSDTIKPILSDVDVVAICTPAEHHGGKVVELLSYNKDVFVEKPLSLKSSQAAHIEKLSREKGTIVMVGHQLLYHPAFRALEDLIFQGELGSIRAISTDRTGLIKNTGDPGLLWSFGPHDVSMILKLAGQMPCKISVRGYPRCTEPALLSKVDIRLTFESGLTAKIRLASSALRQRRLTVEGSLRSAIFDDSYPGGRLFLLNGNDERDLWTIDGNSASTLKEMEFPLIEPLAEECRHLSQCLTSRDAPKTGPKHALAVTRILERVSNLLYDSPAVRSVAV